MACFPAHFGQACKIRVVIDVVRPFLDFSPSKILYLLHISGFIYMTLNLSTPEITPSIFEYLSPLFFCTH